LWVICLTYSVLAESRFHTSGKDNAKVADGVRPLEVYMCSVVKKAGYADGFKWLSNHLKSSE
jgi:GTP-binding protein SAR1